MKRQWFMLGLVPLVLLFGAACSGGDDSDGDTGGSDPAPVATDEPAPAATDEPAVAMTEAPTEEAQPAAPPFGVDNIDGLACSGDWTNLTFGSTGSFEAMFDVNDAGDGGTITVSIGGFAFGGEAGTIEIPFTQDGTKTTIAGDLGFLGQADIVFDSGAPGTGPVLTAPPALNAADSGVELTEFTFDGSVLNAKVTIDFGSSGQMAESELESSCG